jgi:hypothetical protein
VRRQLAELLVGLSWWPPDVEFDFADLATVYAVLEAQKRSR